MTRACKAPATIDREGGDCADPTCRAHDVNEDGPTPIRPTMPCGCDGAATRHTCGGIPDLVGALREAVDRARNSRLNRPTRNPDHDTACRCPGCLADPYVDPA